MDLRIGFEVQGLLCHGQVPDHAAYIEFMKHPFLTRIGGAAVRVVHPGSQDSVEVST